MGTRGGDPEDIFGDDEPLRPPLPADDRLWRHPSELARQLPLPLGLSTYRPGRSRWALVGAVVGGALAASMAILALGQLNPRPPRMSLAVGAPSTTSLTQPPGPSDTATVGGWVTETARRFRQALVGVDVSRKGTTSQGSGVAVGPGLVLTAAGLVGGSHGAVVVLPDGRRFEASLRGEDRDTGLAVLSVDAPGLHPLNLAGSDPLTKGEMAMAVAPSPVAGRDPSVSVGTVRAVHQPFTVGNGMLLDTVEIDAPLARDGTGGLLIDGQGEVVGLTLLKAPGYPSMSVAVPAVLVAKELSALVDNGHVVHGWLGVTPAAPGSTRPSLAGLSTGGAMRIGLAASTSGGAAGPGGASAGATAGVAVGSVVPGSPASKAGVAPGNVIESVGGQATPSFALLQQAVRLHSPGDKVTLTVERGGRQCSLPAVLAGPPS
ncbi:MAG: S1C family serine protease [Acidimicrobiales bacterium]